MKQWLNVGLSITLLSVGCESKSSPTEEQVVEGMKGGDSSEQTVDWSSCAQWRYDPTGDQLTAYPDDELTVEDATTRTGLKVQLTGRGWLEGHSRFVQRLSSDIDRLDGWGINAGIVLKFDGVDLSSAGDLIAPLASEVLKGLETRATHYAMVYMEDGTEEVLPHFPAQVPVEARFFEEGTGVIFEPLRPLKPATRYGLIVRTILPREGQACVAPSDQIAQLLDPMQSPRLASRRQALLDQAELDQGEVAAITAFTTQSAVDIAGEIAAFIRAQTFTWNDDLNCTREELYTHCTRSFNAMRFQDEEGVILDATPKSEYALIVHIWRPRNRADETPTLLFGHGIGGDVNNAYFLDEIIDGLPITRIAIDAVAHGEHPTKTADQSFQQVLDFFSLDLATQSINALKARDNFRQSTYDKLQLIELLHQDPDINQDGRADLDLARLGYYGLSLGGIMGVELLSLEPRLDLALLAVPGARLVSVLTDGGVIGDFKPAIYALVGGQEVFNGFTPLAQALLDAADPGTYAPFMTSSLGETLITGPERNGEPPHILIQVAMGDEIVPNNANFTLARALDITQVEPIVQPIPLLDQRSAPLTGGMNGRVFGMFQFDRVTTGPAELSPSSHMNVPTGREGVYQAHKFFQSWIEEGHPIIVDPYDRFNIPPLE